MRSLSLDELHIPFKTSFRHASAERSETSAVWVEAVSDAGSVGHGEGCPRPYVTGETLESARVFFHAHQADVRRSVVDLHSLCAWMATHAHDVDRNPAAWCAVEIALLDAMAHAASQTLEAFLARPALAGRFRYSAVIGDADPPGFAAMTQRFARVGFTDFKIKLSGDIDRDRDKISVLRGLGLPTLRVRVDANNLWSDADDAIRHLRALDGPLFAIEEPLGAGRYDGLARVGDALGVPIVLDESLTRVEQLEHIGANPERWIVNVRVSKMGGVMRSLDVVGEARRLGVPVVVGAQVGETSVLTRAALTVAAAAGDGLVAQEGAFGTHLLERDVCDPPLMFGAGGELDVASHPALSSPGLGLQVGSLDPRVPR